MEVQVSGMKISTKVLSGGERIYIQRLARKTCLSQREKRFILAMRKRYNY